MYLDIEKQELWCFGINGLRAEFDWSLEKIDEARPGPQLQDK